MTPSKKLNDIAHQAGALDCLDFQLVKDQSASGYSIIITASSPYTTIENEKSIDGLVDYLPDLDNLSDSELDFLIQLSDLTVERGSFHSVLEDMRNRTVLPLSSSTSALDFIEDHWGEDEYYVQINNEFLTVNAEDLITDTDPLTMYQELLIKFMEILKVDKKTSRNQFSASLDFKSMGTIVREKQKEILNYRESAFNALKSGDETLCTLVYMTYHEPDRSLAMQVSNAILSNIGCSH